MSASLFARSLSIVGFLIMDLLIWRAWSTDEKQTHVASFCHVKGVSLSQNFEIRWFGLPGMANHLVMASVAVLRTRSSGTSWSTRPIFRASGALYSKPSWRPFSVSLWPTVFTMVSLNLLKVVKSFNTIFQCHKTLPSAGIENKTLPKRCYNSELRFIEADAISRVISHDPVVATHSHQTPTGRTGTLKQNNDLHWSAKWF